MDFKTKLPTPMRPVARRIYHGLYRSGVRVQCLCSDAWRRLRPANPLVTPPAMLRFKVGESTSLEDFTNVGRRTANLIESALEDISRPFESFETVLDFGCGCGRTLLWFTNKYPEQSLHGTDVDDAAIEWCRTRLVSASFAVNSTLPPTCYPDEMFDLVYAISVFTHLDEEYQLRWLSELGRIIRPGGILLFSVHGEHTLHHLPAEDREILKRTGFLFRTSSKLQGIVPDWYHTAFHSREYVLRLSSGIFRTTRAYIDGGLGIQDIVILER